MKAVCIYCGSSPGARPEYAEAARRAGEELARRGIRMIYGGGSVGLMGEAANACMEAGGEVVGVITRQLEGLEVGHGGLTELEVVETMHQRKARMAELTDGFLTLPGGIGTLEELFEALTWAQLQIHAKPIGLLNVAGFFDHLAAFLGTVVTERFLLPEHAEMLMMESDPGVLLKRMAKYEAVVPEDWVRRKTSGTG